MGWRRTLVERSNCIRGLSVKETTHVPCFVLGRYSREGGEGVEVDICRALDLFARAAEGGDLEARKRHSELAAHE